MFNQWMTRAAVLCALGLSFNVSASAKVEQCQLTNIEWLLGSWQHSDSKKVVTETWQQDSITGFVGEGIFSSKKSGKTTQESLRIVTMSEQVYYLAKVDQNPLPIAFKLASCSTNSAVFINETHDFPQKIHYQLTDKSQIKASVTDMSGQGFTLNFQKK